VAKVTVSLPLPWRSDGSLPKTVEVDADDLATALERVASRSPHVRRAMYRVDGQLRESIGVFVNDRDARGGDGLRHRLRDGDGIVVVAASAGG